MGSSTRYIISKHFFGASTASVPSFRVQQTLRSAINLDHFQKLLISTSPSYFQMISAPPTPPPSTPSSPTSTSLSHSPSWPDPAAILLSSTFKPKVLSPRSRPRSLRSGKLTRFELSLVDHLADFLEGGGGQTIKSIVEATRVQAQLTGGAGEKKFVCWGSASAVAKARQLVDARYVPPSTLLERPLELQFCSLGGVPFLQAIANPHSYLFGNQTFIGSFFTEVQTLNYSDTRPPATKSRPIISTCRSTSFSFLPRLPPPPSSPQSRIHSSLNSRF